MMKVMISLLLLVCLVFSSIGIVSGNYMDKSLEEMGYLGIIQASDYNSFGGVTRYQVIKAITLAMGLSNTMAGNADVIMYPETNFLPIDRPLEEFAYSDFEEMDNEYYNRLFNQNHTKRELEENYWHIKYSSKQRGAVTVAFYNDITKGVIIDGKRYFLFEKEASLNEILIFMLRCLRGADTDISRPFGSAVEIGLIDPEGHFDKTELQNTEIVSLEYFSIIMKRFIEQKRYMYFDEDAETFPKVSIDNEGLTTYKDYIVQNINKDSDCFVNGNNIEFLPEMPMKVANVFFEETLPDTAKIINFEYFVENGENYYKAKISFKKEDLQVIKSCFDGWMQDDGRFLHQYNKECSWWQLTDINEALYAYGSFKSGVKVKTIEMYAYIVENGNDEYILYLVN